LRGLLRETLTRSWLFTPAMKLGLNNYGRSILPSALRAKVPAEASRWPAPHCAATQRTPQAGVDACRMRSTSDDAKY
jgi:hypothetical protein